MRARSSVKQDDLRSHLAGLIEQDQTKYIKNISFFIVMKIYHSLNNSKIYHSLFLCIEEVKNSAGVSFFLNGFQWLDFILLHRTPICRCEYTPTTTKIIFLPTNLDADSSHDHTRNKFEKLFLLSAVCRNRLKYADFQFLVLTPSSSIFSLHPRRCRSYAVT